MKTSQKQCHEAASELARVSGKTCEFFAKENGRKTVDVWYDGILHEFKSNTDAEVWMLEETIRHYEF